jgi:tetratricopeptide (TPR) repeat protein
MTRQFFSTFGGVAWFLALLLGPSRALTAQQAEARDPADTRQASPAEQPSKSPQDTAAGRRAQTRDLVQTGDSKTPDAKGSMGRDAALVRQGDEAMKRLQPSAALGFYQNAVSTNPRNYEALWKTGRALIDVGELEKRGNSQKDKYNKALKYAERAIQVNPDDAEGHFVHAYALGRVALFEGGKTKLRLSKEVKAEAQRAIDLNPLHNGAYHILGGWNYNLADLNFMERALANTILGGVPDDASFENAAHYYELAIQAKPDHVNHHLEYARTLLKLDRKDDARAELEKALELPAADLDDKAHKRAARELLEELS